MRVCAILLMFAATAWAAEQKSAPLKKVISMLNDMLAKGKKEKQDETVRFASYKQFCESTSAEKTSSITKSKEAIEQLQASIAKAESDAQVAAKYIAGLDADVVAWKEDADKATKQREIEHKAFEEAHKEYVDAIDAVERAMGMLNKGPGLGFAQTSKREMFALLQKSSKLMPQKAKKVVMSFLQKSVDQAGKALLQEAEEEGVFAGQQQPVAPEAAAFESSSGGIIELVENLGDKFMDEKRELEKREANAKSAFELMIKDLNGQIATAQMERGYKESEKAERLKDAAEGKGDLADTQAALAEDEKFLADLNAECEQKSFDYNARQTVRAGEIEAIGKAIEIMTDPSVTGAADKHLSLAQVKQAVSLVQLRSSATVQYNVQAAAANFLYERAGKIDSKVLMLLASKTAADPFKKVKKMIQDMIQKLMEEANEEAEHKAFCDAEMGTNKQTRDTKTEQSESLKADIEEFTADIGKLAAEITELNTELAAIDAAVEKATSERQAEKAKNQETLSDATVAADATAKALQVLKDFYEQAATPIEQPAPQQGPIKYDNRALQILSQATGGASFIQIDSKQKQPGAPEMEEGQYSGMANGGVLGLMEVVQSDFEKVISETTATESDAAKIYDEFMADSSQDKAVKETDVKHKIAAKSEKESSLASAKKDLRITQEELMAALQYYEKLKPSCEEKVMSYEEKVAQRKAEIESLKEALEILSDPQR